MNPVSRLNLSVLKQSVKQLPRPIYFQQWGQDQQVNFANKTRCAALNNTNESIESLFIDFPTSTLSTSTMATTPGELQHIPVDSGQWGEWWNAHSK